MNLQPRLGRMVLPVFAALAVAAGGCGGDSSSASDSTTKTTSQDAARVKFAQCLRENGIDVSDSTSQGNGPPAGIQNVDQAKLRTAMRACQTFQQAAVGDISKTQQQDFQDAFAKFSSCMRAHGVDLPDVSPGQDPTAGGAQIDQHDPKVQAAQKACQDKLPKGGLGGGGGQ